MTWAIESTATTVASEHWLLQAQVMPIAPVHSSKWRYGWALAQAQAHAVDEYLGRGHGQGQGHR